MFTGVIGSYLTQTYRWTSVFYFTGFVNNIIELPSIQQLYISLFCIFNIRYLMECRPMTSLGLISMLWILVVRYSLVQPQHKKPKVISLQSNSTYSQQPGVAVPVPWSNLMKHKSFWWVFLTSLTYSTLFLCTYSLHLSLTIFSYPYLLINNI